MSVPTVTVTGTLQDIFGNVNAGTLLFTLCGYGAQIPRISGTSMIARTQPLKVVPNGSGFFSVTLWGNDVLLPGPDITYYSIQLRDDSGNVISTTAYRFDGSATVDLSTLAPISPSSPNVVPQAVLLNPGGLQTINGAITIIGNLSVTGNVSASGSITGLGLVTVTFSATPAFDGNQGNAFDITLTGNVTGPTFPNLINGRVYYMVIQQDGTGGRTWAWPASVKGASTISPTANVTSIQPFIKRADGNLYAAGPMMFI